MMFHRNAIAIWSQPLSCVLMNEAKYKTKSKALLNDPKLVHHNEYQHQQTDPRAAKCNKETGQLMLQKFVNLLKNC